MGRAVLAACQRTRHDSLADATSRFRVITRYVKPFVATGIIGSFTTWSHFIVEVDQLIGADQIRRAIVYAAASRTLGLLRSGATTEAVALLGSLLARLLLAGLGLWLGGKL